MLGALGIPVVQTGGQTAHTLVQQVVVAQGDDVEPHVDNRIAQRHGRIEVEISAGDLIVPVADQHLLIDDVQVAVNQPLHIVIAIVEVVFLSVFGVCLGAVIDALLHQIVSHCHHMNGSCTVRSSVAGVLAGCEFASRRSSSRRICRNCLALADCLGTAASRQCAKEQHRCTQQSGRLSDGFFPHKPSPFF